MTGRRPGRVPIKGKPRDCGAFSFPRFLVLHGLARTLGWGYFRAASPQ